MTGAFARRIESLGAASRRAQRGLGWDLEWPAALPEDAWCFSPEWISLYGSPAYEALDDAQRRRLSRCEAINFFSLNVHGERTLLQGLVRRLHRRASSEYASYLHHFVDEENKHMAYFASFCHRYGGGVYPDRRLAFPTERDEGEDDVLFFTRVLVFEEIVDAYNRAMAEDERLHPLVRRIHAAHHEDESRHLAFGRSLVARLFERHAPSWPEETRARLRDDVWRFVDSFWKEYANPDAYREAGLPDPHARRDEALTLPSFHERRQRLTAPCATWLIRRGVLDARSIA